MERAEDRNRKHGGSGVKEGTNGHLPTTRQLRDHFYLATDGSSGSTKLSSKNNNNNNNTTTRPATATTRGTITTSEQQTEKHSHVSVIPVRNVSLSLPLLQ